jgi:hypothetical protein
VPRRRSSTARTAALLLAVVVLLPALSSGCNKPYRVGEHVWVEWDGKNYPAYIIEKKTPTRFRVHFDGYDSRWDEDVTLDRVKGRVEGPAIPPPPPERVARAAGVSPKASSSVAPGTPFKVGDRVKVRWRGSVYPATVVGVVAADRFLVHYEGHESAWDETVPLDRIAARR